MVGEVDEPDIELRIAEDLVRGVIRRGSGQHSTECLQNYPRDVYFLGNLRSRLDIVGRTQLPGELLSKLSPFAMGAELLLNVRQADGAVEITLRWSVYYRIFPTYEQQVRHQSPGGDPRPADDVQAEGAAAIDDVGLETDGAGDQDEQAVDVGEYGHENPPPPVPPRRRRAHGGSDSLAVRFRRIDCSAAAQIPVTLQQGVWQLNSVDLQRAIDAELISAEQVAQQDLDRYRAGTAIDERTTVPAPALQSPQTFQQFLSTLRVEVPPSWAIEAVASARLDTTIAQGVVFSIDITNASGQVRNPNVEFFLFDVQIELRPIGCMPLPFSIELAPKGFRYSRDMWGQGFNCALERIDERTFRTAHSPVFRQARYVTQSDPPARFDALANEPIPILRNIERAMRAYRQGWLDARREYEERDASWSHAHGAEFDRDLAQFDGEITRFGLGVHLIEADADCRAAFRLANETFRRLGNSGPQEKRKYQWRLFQVVFIVSQIPGLFGHKVASSERDAELSMVDVIYFPTGGGKTEAYLGTIAFHCFFDRLRGKTAGVTCWTRFPLRLLTLQQTQRMAEVIGVANLIRLESPDVRLSGRTIDPFAIGYFVGSEGTPNKLVPPNGNGGQRDARDEVNWSKAIDPQMRQAWRRVVTCPSCRTDTVVVDFDVDSVRLLHRCTQPTCRFLGGVLPVYVIDTEIYRYLPSVVVGTVDKLAAIGNQRKFSLLLGAVQGRCTKHGYYSGACTQDGCKNRRLLNPGRPSGLSGPTLFVQDELHLLKEGLGTFDSHYETFIQRLARELGAPRPIKIIASSATIEQFERQVEHLYGKDRVQARIFPGLGPRLSESFYARTLAQPQRVYVGLLPHNKTIFNAVLELIEYYHIEALSLRQAVRGAGGGAPAGQPQVPAELSDLYQTSVTYFLANRELNSIRTDLESDVNPRLQESGYSALQLRELTGSTSTDDVTRTLRKLETPLAQGESPDCVLANQMVSHGVDIDRLNAMIFYGMPRLTAEYIQASSRVGRSHVGIVLLCHHSARERDQSHFQYFYKYHEYLGQLIEPVAINRWATYSVVRTLPGLFMAVLLQVISGRLSLKSPGMIYIRSVIQQMISSGQIQAADFEQLLHDAYLDIGGGDAASRARFEQQIRLRIPQFIDQIIQPGGTDPWVSSALIPTPMTSLRDVEEAIPIELDAEGSDWGR